MLIRVFLLFFFLLPSFSSAQCETFDQFSSAEEDSLMRSFVIYRDYLKEEKLDQAFPHWEKVYQNAPAVNGRNTHVYTDGMLFYLRKFYQEKNRKKKTEITEKIKQLNEELRECYPDSEKVELDNEILKFVD